MYIRSMTTGKKLVILKIRPTIVASIHDSRQQTMYSEVPNKSVTFFIIFWDVFLPAWPYYELHVY